MPFLPEEEWTPTMFEIDRLISEHVFTSPDAMEFADLTPNAYQSWFKRGYVKVDGMKFEGVKRRPLKDLEDAGTIGTGRRRMLNLVQVLALATGEHVGRRCLGRTLDYALNLGGVIAVNCVGRWMYAAKDYDDAEVSAGPEPLAVLKKLIVDAKTAKQAEFLVVGANDARLARWNNYLGDVTEELKESLLHCAGYACSASEAFFSNSAAVI